ncbi:MAG: M56 family metallopeptidase [Christensenellales bacterium]|jgi:beta-lactamase regulating signal transducer with metallopeptidase domain
MSNAMTTILSMSLSGTALSLAVFILKPFLRNRVSKAFSYYIWILVLLRLVLPFGYGLNLMELAPAGLNNAQSIVAAENGGNHSLNRGSSNETQTNPAPLSPLPTTFESDMSRDVVKDEFNLWEFITGNVHSIWLLGAGLSLLWYTFAYALFSWRIRRTCIKPHEADIAVFEKMRGGKNILLACNSRTNTPMLMGTWKPIIVLPQTSYVENGMETDLKNILQHELMHHQRRDTLYKWFVILVTSLHWFNPFVYLLRREIGSACELSCDEAVIKNMTAIEKKSYGNTLLTLSARNRLPIGIMTTTMSENKSQLKGRLKNIMNYKKISVRAVVLMLLLAVALTGCASVLPSLEPTTNKTEDNIPAKTPILSDTNTTPQPNPSPTGEPAPSPTPAFQPYIYVYETIALKEKGSGAAIKIPIDDALLSRIEETLKPENEVDAELDKDIWHSEEVFRENYTDSTYTWIGLDVNLTSSANLTSDRQWALLMNHNDEGVLCDYWENAGHGKSYEATALCNDIVALADEIIADTEYGDETSFTLLNELKDIVKVESYLPMQDEAGHIVGWKKLKEYTDEKTIERLENLLANSAATSLGARIKPYYTLKLTRADGKEFKVGFDTDVYMFDINNWMIYYHKSGKNKAPMNEMMKILGLNEWPNPYNN